MIPDEFYIKPDTVWGESCTSFLSRCHGVFAQGPSLASLYLLTQRRDILLMSLGERVGLVNPLLESLSDLICRAWPVGLLSCELTGMDSAPASETEAFNSETY